MTDGNTWDNIEDLDEHAPPLVTIDDVISAMHEVDERRPDAKRKRLAYLHAVEAAFWEGRR